MRKCTRVSLKRPCSYRIRWGFLHFPAVFPPPEFSPSYFNQRKKKRNLSLLSHGFVVVITVALCTNHAGIERGDMVNCTAGGFTEDFYFCIFFKEVVFVKGGKPDFIFWSSEVKEVVSHQHNRDGTLDFSTARYYSPSRLHDVRSPCKDTPTSNTTASSFTTGRTVK